MEFKFFKNIVVYVKKSVSDSAQCVCVFVCEGRSYVKFQLATVSGLS